MAPNPNIPLVLILVSAPIVFGVILVTVRMVLRFAARRRRTREPRAEVRRCVCGYRLAGIAMPRCPECGRAIGFDKTFEELGLTDDELRRIRERAERHPPEPPPAKLA